MKHAAIRPLRSAVHIVDDDADTRRALWYMLEEAGHAPRVFVSATDYLDELDYLPPAPLLADLSLADMDGRALLAAVKRVRPLVPVILIASLASVAVAVAAMKAGAFDFLEKPLAQAELFSTVSSALEDLAQAVQLDTAGDDAVRRVAALSGRERDVLDRLAAGKSNKIIAFELGLSIRTVEMHRIRMMRRLAVGGLPDALRIAHLAGLDRSPPATPAKPPAAPRA